MCDIGMDFLQVWKSISQRSTKLHNSSSKSWKHRKFSKRRFSPNRYSQHTIGRLVSDNWETESLAPINALSKEPVSTPFHLTCFFPSLPMWKLHVWSSVTFTIISQMTATCVELHDFRGLYIVRIWGYWKWVSMLDVGLRTNTHETVKLNHQWSTMYLTAWKSRRVKRNHCWGLMDWATIVDLKWRTS
jgi:hypothetical protein